MALEDISEQSKGAIRLILVEDQTILCESLSAAIDAQPDMSVVLELADASKAPSAVRQLQPDVVLMDVCTLNDASGIVATRKIKQENPEVKVVVMTGMPEVTFRESARDAGADSFVYKNVGTRELLSVIRSTYEGQSTFYSIPDDKLRGVDLSEDEFRILCLVCETKSRKEIAAELYMSEGTVKRRISDILAKTGFDSIMKLAVHAVGHGYIVPQISGKEEAE